MGLHQFFNLLFFVKRADKFGGVFKGRIVLVHQHLGHNAGDLAIDTAVVQHVQKTLLQHIAHASLGVSHQHTHGQAGNHPG